MVERCQYTDGPQDGADCPCYGQGYAEGKDKALEEVAGHAGDGHHPECKSDVCRVYNIVLNDVVGRMLANLSPGVMLDVEEELRGKLAL